MVKPRWGQGWEMAIKAIRVVKPGVTEDQLLSEKGWFFLRDLFEVLDPEDSGKYKLAFKQIQRLIEKDQDPFEVMGRRKVGGRVVVKMERFAPWYRGNPMFKTRKLDGTMSFKEFLEQKDCYFRLSQVCNHYENFLPYTYSYLKREADRREDSLAEMGVLKCDTTYLVALPRFEEWLRQEILG
jgi:hypothetical protein